jgi:hypothetical protein
MGFPRGCFVTSHAPCFDDDGDTPDATDEQTLLASFQHDATARQLMASE